MSISKPFAESHPHLVEFMQVLEVTSGESARGSVLVHAATLDELLKRSIDAFLVAHRNVAKLTDGFSAPLGSFSARILMAFALGILSPLEYKELELIRKIRNDFAHSIAASFEDQSIAARCDSLTFAIKQEDGSPVAPSKSFSTAAASLHLNLVNRAHYVASKRLKFGDWQY